VAGIPLPLLFTDVFAERYHALDDRDAQAVDDMLDRLEVGHGDPEMRDIVRVGSESLYATPRIYTTSTVLRITWQYDDRRHPTAVACITVAEI
jgi:hypothetical protein